MGSVWFPGIHFLLLLTTLSFTTHGLQDNHTNNNHLIKVYHSENKSPLKELLSRDQARVKSLDSMMLVHQQQRAEVKSNHVNIGLNSGLSIGSGNYYVKVGLGSPAKYYPMLVDTGSSLSWVQCQPCRVYCHSQAGPVFDPAASSSYATVPCAASECAATKRATLNEPFCAADKSCVYTASYGDASFSIGYLARDRLSLSASRSVPGFVYGCGQDNQGLFGLSAGILGLARDALSLPYQAAGKLGRGFSYCLPSADAGRAAGGFLSLGAAGSAGPRYSYTPMKTDPKNPSLYFVDLAGVTVGGSRVLAAPAGAKTIVDSGTVITRLPRGLYAAVRDSFRAAVNGRLAEAPRFSILDTCFKAGMAAAARASPELRIRFRGGAELVVGPDNALMDAGGGVVCLAFAATDGVAIIGNRQQQRYTVAYDVDKSRIGFAPGGCS